MYHNAVFVLKRTISLSKRIKILTGFQEVYYTILLDVYFSIN